LAGAAAVVTASPPSTATPTAAVAAPFSLALLPPAALEALAKLAPGFTLFDRRSYPDSIASRAHESRDAGLVFLRGDFQGLGRVDYVVVVGNQRRSYRVVALFAGAGGTFRALDVYGPKVVADSTLSPGVPPLFVERDECRYGCRHGRNPQVIVVTWFLASRFGVDETRYIWSDAYSFFMLDEVND
jgi:hypothetical protein